MSGRDDSFVKALGRGEKEALEEFYGRLERAEDDQGFWDYLTGLLPRGAAVEGDDGLPLLKRFLGAGSLDAFLKAAPVHVVILFMAFAMLFAACSEAEQPEEEAPLEPAAAEPAPEPAAEPAAEAAPAEPAADQGPDIEKMSADELRENLLTYITKAELPASEKRRLKKVLKKAKGKKLVESRDELATLFKTEDPAQIAAALEEMVLFQKTKKPKMMTRYKGVDFPEDEEDENEPRERIPMMQTLYKGVDFPES